MAQEELLQLKSININTAKSIAKISIKVDDDQILGLRLIDDKGNYLADIVWCICSDDGEWVTKNIPDGLEIIGIRYEPSTGQYITKLEFILGSKDRDF